MAGFRNGILYARNVDFVGTSPNISPQITANGQLLIGSASGPTILAGFLSSLDSSLTITNGPGTIDLSVNSAGIALTITGDNGVALSPVAGNWLITGMHGINTNGLLTNNLRVAINNAITLGDLVVLGAGVAALTAQTGDITISSGNLSLPTTASTNVGVIKVNSNRFIHTFGIDNTFVGINSGNFTLTGQGCTAVGTNVMTVLTNGLRNSGLGNGALEALTIGVDNVAIGTNALNVESFTDEI